MGARFGAYHGLARFGACHGMARLEACHGMARFGACHDTRLQLAVFTITRLYANGEGFLMGACFRRIRPLMFARLCALPIRRI